MKKIIYTLLTIITLNFITTSAYALTVRGAPSCGSWIDSKEKNTSAGWNSIAQRGWLIGFLSGAAMSSYKDILKDTDNESLSLWVDNYCRANPLKDVGDAGYDLFEELKKQKGLE